MKNKLVTFRTNQTILAQVDCVDDKSQLSELPEAKLLLAMLYQTINDALYEPKKVRQNATSRSVTSLKSKNKIAFAKQNYTNKIIISNSVPIQTFTNPIPYNNDGATITEIRTLIFPNLTTANMYGFNERLVPMANAPVISATYVNIMNLMGFQYLITIIVIELTGNENSN